jgi:hypothetical protein
MNWKQGRKPLTRKTLAAYVIPKDVPERLVPSTHFEGVDLHFILYVPRSNGKDRQVIAYAIMDGLTGDGRSKSQGFS